MKTPLPPWRLDPASAHPILARWQTAFPHCLRCMNPPLRGQLVCHAHQPHDDGVDAYWTGQLARLPILTDSLPVCTFCREKFLANAMPFGCCQACVLAFVRRVGILSRVDTPDATE